MKTTKYSIRVNIPFGDAGEIVSFNEELTKWQTEKGHYIEKKYLSNTDFFKRREEEKAKCPLCDSDLKHVLQKNTSIYSCINCTFLGFEYFGKENICQLTEYLK